MFLTAFGDEGSRRPMTDRLKKLLEIMCIHREGNGKYGNRSPQGFKGPRLIILGMGGPLSQPEMITPTGERAPEMERHVRKRAFATAENDGFLWVPGSSYRFMVAIAR